MQRSSYTTTVAIDESSDLADIAKLATFTPSIDNNWYECLITVLRRYNLESTHFSAVGRQKI